MDINCSSKEETSVGSRHTPPLVWFPSLVEPLCELMLPEDICSLMAVNRSWRQAILVHLLSTLSDTPCKSSLATRSTKEGVSGGSPSSEDLLNDLRRSHLARCLLQAVFAQEREVRIEALQAVANLCARCTKEQVEYLLVPCKGLSYLCWQLNVYDNDCLPVALDAIQKALDKGNHLAAALPDDTREKLLTLAESDDGAISQRAKAIVSGYLASPPHPPISIGSISPTQQQSSSLSTGTVNRSSNSSGSPTQPVLKSTVGTDDCSAPGKKDSSEAHSLSVKNKALATAASTGSADNSSKRDGLPVHALPRPSLPNRPAAGRVIQCTLCNRTVKVEAWLPHFSTSIHRDCVIRAVCDSSAPPPPPFTSTSPVGTPFSGPMSCWEVVSADQLQPAAAKKEKKKRESGGGLLWTYAPKRTILPAPAAKGEQKVVKRKKKKVSFDDEDEPVPSPSSSSFPAAAIAYEPKKKKVKVRGTGSGKSTATTAPAAKPPTFYIDDPDDAADYEGRQTKEGQEKEKKDRHSGSSSGSSDGGDGEEYQRRADYGLSSGGFVQSVRQCSYCGKAEGAAWLPRPEEFDTERLRQLFPCPYCRTNEKDGPALYCSRRCQELDWEDGHEEECIGPDDDSDA